MTSSAKPGKGTSSEKHRVEHRRELVAKASAGDVNAGRAMVQHAMAAIRGQETPSEADAVALNWLADGLAAFLAGMPLERALCVELNGRPGVPPMARFLFEVWPIFQEVESLAAQLVEQGLAAPRAAAVRRVARSRGISESKVRSAVTEAKRIVAASGAG